MAEPADARNGAGGLAAQHAISAHPAPSLSAWTGHAMTVESCAENKANVALVPVQTALRPHHPHAAKTLPA